MTPRFLRTVYIVAAATVVGGVGLWVLIRDATPALLIPAAFGASGILGVGEGLRALARGAVDVRWWESVERGSSPAAFWFIVLVGRFGLGAAAIGFALYIIPG